jgi:hypothetical protein
MPERVSRGQAEVVLNAGPSGGSAIRNRSGGVLRGAPADNEVRAAIRPLRGFEMGGPSLLCGGLAFAKLRGGL